MYKEVEEIKNIANKFKEKHPEAEPFLDDMIYHVNFAQDHANRCLVFLLLGDYEGFDRSMTNLYNISDLDSEDYNTLYNIHDKLISNIEKALKEKCGCELPPHH